jgi:ATP-binding cassette subfamily B protein
MSAPAPVARHDVEREDKVRSGTTLTEVLKRLWPHFMKQKVRFFSTIAAVFALVIGGRLTIFAFAYAIDHGVNGQNRNIIVIAAICYLFLEINNGLMEFTQNYLFATLGNRILYDMRRDLLGHVQSLPLTYFDKNPSGRIVTRLTNDVVGLGEVFTQGLINVFGSIVTLIGIVIAMLMISWKGAVATLLIAPPLVWIVSILSRKLLITMRESKAKIAAINAYVAENINGMRVVQLYDRVGKNTKKFNTLSADYRIQMLKTVQLYALLWPTTSFFNAASVAVAFYFGGKFTIDGSITIGAMVAFILNVAAFVDPLNVILEKYQVFQNSLSSAERIYTLFDEKPEEIELAEPVKGSRLRGEIDFKNVTFSYGPKLQPALKNVDIHIRAGESVALVGRTGSGKSTTISLLQRLYDITAGEILIDGRSINSYPRRDLRSRVGVVQQDTFMFRGTVAENIGLSDPKISRMGIEQAAQGARLEEFASRHEGGLDAKVEERGANLSFGEKQLIAFARILAFDPDILILDEATANIDSHTEELIQEATRKVRQGRTSLIIAHRISTIMDCDKIIVMDHGEIKEVGSHNDLYARGGIYRALCDAQFNEQAASV